MDSPRLGRGRRLSTSVALATLKGTALCALLSLVVAQGSAGAPGTEDADPAPPAASECSRVWQPTPSTRTSSAAPDSTSTPRSAVIRTDGGQLRQVSFEVGWAVYTGRRPGTLVAVCS